MLAGQTGMDASGKITAPGDMVGQFRQALSNLAAVVQAGGGLMTDMVKLNLFVTDKAAYQANVKAIGQVYRTFFGKYFPAMTLVEVKSLWDPEALIEMEGMAVLETPNNRP